MLCPITLCIGTFLTKLTDKMITIFPFKITLIFLGSFGTIISFLLSGINQKTIIESVNTLVNPLDMIIGCGTNFVHLVSEFGWISFFRLLLNIIIPGVGTLTYLKKYGCTFGIILASLFQFFGGYFFIISVKILRTGKESNINAYNKLFFKVLKTTQNGDPYIMNILLKYLIIFIQWDFVFIFQELLLF